VSLPHKDYTLPVPDLSPRPDNQGRLARRAGRGNDADYWNLCIAPRWAALAAAYEASPGDAYAAWHYLDSHPAFWEFGQQSAAEVLLDRRPRNHVSLLEYEYAFQRGAVEIIPRKVNPATGYPDEQADLNTRLEWGYEFGPMNLLPRNDGSGPAHGDWRNDGSGPAHGDWHHDWPLDGTAATYEQAVIDVALKVWTHYGNDRVIVDAVPVRVLTRPAR
jgi:hypothetical protein